MAPESDRVLNTHEGVKTGHAAQLGRLVGELGMRQRDLKSLAVASCVLALAGALPSGAAGEKPTAKSTRNSGSAELVVGISTNDIFTDNLDKAEAAAQQIEDLGATAVRFFYTLNKGTAWQNYTQETCNAFQAAYDHHLQPIVAFRGYDEDGPGYVPSSPTEMRQFNTTAASIIWTVASNKDAQHPGGCVPQQKNFIFEGINEINADPPFNRYLDANTPVQALIMDSRLSRTLKKEAARPEIQATVSFGESLSVGSHDVLGFLKAQAQAETDLNIQNPYDFIDVHPYPKNPTDDPSITMANLDKPINDLLNSSFPGTKLVWGEIGVETVDPPASEASAYSPPVSHAIGVSESTQAKYITNFLKTAATEGSPWVTLFGLQDDGNGSTPSSGEYYVSGNPKSSEPAIKYQIGKYK